MKPRYVRGQKGMASRRGGKIHRRLKATFAIKTSGTGKEGRVERDLDCQEGYDLQAGSGSIVSAGWWQRLHSYRGTNHLLRPPAYMESFENRTLAFLDSFPLIPTLSKKRTFLWLHTILTSITSFPRRVWESRESRPP